MQTGCKLKVSVKQKNQTASAASAFEMKRSLPQTEKFLLELKHEAVSMFKIESLNKKHDMKNKRQHS